MRRHASLQTKQTASPLTVDYGAHFRLGGRVRLVAVDSVGKVSVQVYVVCIDAAAFAWRFVFATNIRTTITVWIH